tara:strand:- start:239 stop:766 length:528 start_codon:yes stop_codon:yes gene_type:complete
MKYISQDKNSLGIKGVPQGFVNHLMEGLGAAPVGEAEEIPALYENNGSVFGLEETVYEHEDFMFLKLSELSDNQYSQLTESNTITENVVFNEVEFGLSEDIYEIEGEYYVALTEDVEVEEDNETVLTVEGRDYIVCDSEEDADFVAFLSEDDNGEFTVVDEDDEYEHALYVKEVN